MSVIVVPPQIRDQLLASLGEAEIRDESGRFIGRFTPANTEIPELDLTEAEIAALLSPDRPTFTTAEVLAFVKGAVS
jgi:hypothetical protein